MTEATIVRERETTRGVLKNRPAGRDLRREVDNMLRDVAFCAGPD